MDFSLRQFFIVATSINMKGVFTFLNIKMDAKLEILLSILKKLGLQFEIEGNKLTVTSFGAECLFEPEQVLDIKGEPSVLYALCGLFAGLDYQVFFEDSTGSKQNFSPLILGLYDVGVRFQYSKDFTAPLSLKGTSNLIPMSHNIISNNPLLHMLFVIIGLSGIGKTRVISPFPTLDFFTKVLAILKADVKKVDEGEIVLASLKQEVKNIITLDFNILNEI